MSGALESAAPTELHYLADLRGIVKQFVGFEVLLVFDEIIPQAAVGEVLHYQPQVPASCREKGAILEKGGKKKSEQRRSIRSMFSDDPGSKWTLVHIKQASTGGDIQSGQQLQAGQEQSTLIRQIIYFVQQQRNYSHANIFKNRHFVPSNSWTVSTTSSYLHYSRLLCI